MKTFLGINMSGRDSSAALVSEGKVHFAVREERLNREKKTRKFPLLAIRECLRAGGIGLADVDRVAVSWNPAINLERFNSAQSGTARYKPEHLYAVPNHLFTFLDPDEGLRTDEIFHFASGRQLAVQYVNHHLAHAADVFLLSPYDESAILIMDAYGEKHSVTFALGRGSSFQVLQTVLFPHSLGSFYGAMTQYLGFTPDLDEWKVMGAGAYGDPQRFIEFFRGLFRRLDNGAFELDLSYFDFPLFTRPTLYSDKLVAALGAVRHREHDLEQRHFDVAAAVQQVTEEIAFHMLAHLHRLTGLKAVCISGGVAMNCLLNGKVTSRTPFEKVWIGSSPDDGGTSVGAALYSASLSSTFPRHPAEHNYWGTEYDASEIRSELAKYGLRYSEVKDPHLEAARRVARGEIVAWFQGRMEFGERALGNRSILADPRDPAMKDKINRAIKYREAFRPFAPSVPEEQAHEFFEHADYVPFMEKALVVRPSKRSVLPAVTHQDGTARLQTVRKSANPSFWSLIDAFGKMTGVPVLLNTSFNLQGEPIVGTPKDAIRTFYSSGLDALFLGNTLLVKS
ncbi:MAG: carbamoyltransferase [Nitrospirae bacterium]|nr:carbamoyltransferase [Nitrospirota bacterium]